MTRLTVLPGGPDEAAMEHAIAAAAYGDGIPMGCVILSPGGVLIASASGTGTWESPTNHCEIVAIKAACDGLAREKDPEWLSPMDRLLRGCTLFSTLEPCTMCCGAINHAKISRVVWGASRDAFPHLFRRRRVSAPACLTDTTYPPIYRSGVLREQCEALLHGWDKWD